MGSILKEEGGANRTELQAREALGKVRLNQDTRGLGENPEEGFPAREGVSLYPSILHQEPHPEDVNKDSEMLWLDALDAEEKGDRDAALAIAREVVEIDDEHSEAWMAIAQWSLPVISRGKQIMPNLNQASKSISALRKVVEIDPSNSNAWSLGGTILIDHLGMLEHGLEWWEERRKVDSNDVVPIIEQLGILVRLGYFEECKERLKLLFGGEIDIPPNRSLERKVSRVKTMVERASRFEGDSSFNPVNAKDEGWVVIKRMKDRKPMSETFFMLTFVAPIVFLLGSVAMYIFGSSAIGSIGVFILILLLYFLVGNFSIGLLHKLNRHALDLDRAMDCETTVGKSCIPDEVRAGKLYKSVLASRMPAFKERLGYIAESNEAINSDWELAVPF